MTHLRIEQTEGSTEYVSSAVITKLYELATSGDLDVTSNLLGTLHATATYNEYITALTTAYPNLHITASKYYVKFNDPAFQRACALLYGDGVGMTMADFLAVTDFSPLSAFNSNTEITDMTEFKYFINIPAVDDQASTSYRLFDITNLTTISLPDLLRKIVSKTAYNPYASNYLYKGTFYKCDNLQNVHISNNMENLSLSTGWRIMDLRNTKIDGIWLDGYPTEEVYFSQYITHLGSRAFFNCTSMRKVVVPETVGNFIITDDNGYDCMFGTRFLGDCILDLPSTTTQIHTSMFNGGGIGKFIIRATTPPTGIGEGGSASTSSMSNSSNIDLYVPDASISAYLSNTIYSSFKHIYGLSLLPADYSQVPA